MRNALTQDRPTLFIDQYGQRIVATSLKELKQKVYYRGGAAKQYVNTAKGPLWTGYVLGARWFTAFHRAEVSR